MKWCYLSSLSLLVATTAIATPVANDASRDSVEARADAAFREMARQLDEETVAPEAPSAAKAASDGKEPTHESSATTESDAKDKASEASSTHTESQIAQESAPDQDTQLQTRNTQPSSKPATVAEEPTQEELYRRLLEEEKLEAERRNNGTPMAQDPWEEQRGEPYPSAPSVPPTTVIIQDNFEDRRTRRRNRRFWRFVRHLLWDNHRHHRHQARRHMDGRRSFKARRGHRASRRKRKVHARSPHMNRAQERSSRRSRDRRNRR